MKENQRIAVTKRMLQEGLLRLLRTQPIDKIKVTELCEESGINRATFYRHYSLPRDVLDEVRRTVLQELQSCVRRASALGGPRKGLEAICQYCYDHGESLEILFECHTDDGFAQFLNEFYQENLQEFRSISRELHMDNEEMLLVSCYYGGGIYYILRQWLTGKIAKSPAQLADLIYALITARKMDAGEKETH